MENTVVFDATQMGAADALDRDEDHFTDGFLRTQGVSHTGPEWTYAAAYTSHMLPAERFRVGLVQLFGKFAQYLTALDYEILLQGLAQFETIHLREPLLYLCGYILFKTPHDIELYIHLTHEGCDEFQLLQALRVWEHVLRPRLDAPMQLTWSHIMTAAGRTHQNDKIISDLERILSTNISGN